MSMRELLATAQSLARRGRDAEALAILEPHFDDDRLGSDAVDAAVSLVWRVHGIPAALDYWMTRLPQRPRVPGLGRIHPAANPRPRSRRRDRVRVAIVAFNWNFLACEVDALSADPRFDLQTLWPGSYVTGKAASGSRSQQLARAGRRHGEVLRWADVVFCEWCDRPAVWLAACLPARTALCIRLHNYEAHTPYPLLVDWRRVSEAIFVADHIREYVDAPLALTQRVRTSVLPPVHRVADFGREKRPEARWTLGMIGYNRRAKQPLMALEILARLRQYDRRWRLRLVGHGFGRTRRADCDPADGKAFRSTVEALGLSEAVTVSPFTNDVAGWLTRVGFILSTSEREGTHEGVAQGMSSGAIPVVRRWPVFRSFSAAERRYPTALHFDDAREAAAAIRAVARRAASDEAFRACGREYADEARRRFDVAAGIPRFTSVLRRAAGHQE
jgi:hypothetical protein